MGFKPTPRTRSGRSVRTRAWKVSKAATVYDRLRSGDNAHLASELLVDRRERVELVLEVGGVLLVEEAACVDEKSQHRGAGMAASQEESVHVHLDGLRTVNSLASALAGDLLQVVNQEEPISNACVRNGEGRADRYQRGAGWERAGGEPRSAPARMRHITCSSRQRASGGCVLPGRPNPCGTGLAVRKPRSAWRFGSM